MAKYVVTGGGGFVGSAIVRALLKEGHEVIAIARGHYPELESIGAKTRRLDLTKEAFRLEEIFQNTDAVFHVAAKVDMWGDYQSFYEANVLATRSVVAACIASGVQRLIYTSSPSVIADGRDLNGIDESYPYPQKYLANYPKTKAQAEREVLAANSNKLWTIALRPHLIWGPGDNHLVPTIIERARLGKLIRVGDGKNLIDVSYIDDCVQAHLDALKALDANPSSRGKAYFISQGEPVNMWQWIDEILVLNGIEKIKKNIPSKLAYFLAWVLECISQIRPGKPEPLLTRFLVKEMYTSHYFDISAAKKELGYLPKYSIKEAMEVTFR